MIIEHGNQLIVQVDEDIVTRLAGSEDNVLTGWDNANHVPLAVELETEPGENYLLPPVSGEVIGTEFGVTLWLGPRDDAMWADKDHRRVYESPRIWLDSESARTWLSMAGDDATGATEMINTYLVHDSDPEDPDCDEQDPVTKFACTLVRGHDGNKHLAGTGRATIVHGWES